MTKKTEIYKGGFFTLLRHYERRQRPFTNVGLVLPPLDVDLDGLSQDVVPPPVNAKEDAPHTSAEAKWYQLQAEFEGRSGLLLVHAMIVAILRRSDPPPEAIELFHRMWVQKGSELAQELSTRWLISTATTFADHGQNGDQRSLGMGLAMLFDLIKLHDSERRITGQPGHKPFDMTKEATRAAMPLGIPPYSLRKGDLDKVMLARLWQLAERDPTIRPLGMRMLWMVMTDRRTVFARVQKFKTRGEK